LAWNGPDIEAPAATPKSIRGDVPEVVTAGLFRVAGDKNFATGSAADAAERSWREIRRQNRANRPADGESASMVRRNF
jgi:hypothetical protein